MHNPMNGEVQMGRRRGEDFKCLETEDRVSGLVSNCQEIKRSRYNSKVPELISLSLIGRMW